MYALPPHHCSAGISGAVFCVVAINWKSIAIAELFCAALSQWLFEHGHVAIITKT